LVPMSPKGNHHEVLKIALLRHWFRLAPDDCELASETTFRLSEDTYLEPDVVLFPGAIELDDIKGPNVLLVVEIADTSRRYDMGRKANLYASFGVRELWVIDAVKLMTRVFCAPGASGYGETRDFSAAGRIVPRFATEAFALRLRDLKRK
jgi:Uma2 family endonuclease